jgi:predicted CopG family antitoxin
MTNLNEVHERTTISLSRENYEKLKRLGYTADSFNDVIGRLLEQVTKEQER